MKNPLTVVALVVLAIPISAQDVDGTALEVAGSALADARAQQSQRRPAAARASLGRGIEALLELPPEQLEETHLGLLFQLAAGAYATGALGPARSAWERVLEVRTERDAEDHPALIDTQRMLAVVLKGSGELERARQLEEQVVAVYRATLPEDHPMLVNAMQNLAVTLSYQGDYEGARDIEVGVLEYRLKTLPPDHVDVQMARLNLAGTEFNVGDLQRARTLTAQAEEVLRRTLPPGHPKLLLAQGTLGWLMGAVGDLEAARALELQVLEEVLQRMPADHPDVQMARGNLAGTFFRLGDFEGARVLLEEVVDVWAGQLPPEHPDLLTAQGNLAVMVRELGDLEGARELEEHVLEVRTAVFSADHPDVQDARINLAMTLAALGELDRSRELEVAVLDSLGRTMPEDHPHVQVAKGNLAFTLAALRATRGDAMSGNEREALGAEYLELAAEFTSAMARSARSILLESSSREAEERCASLAADVGKALSFATGVGVFETDPALTRDAFVLSEVTRSAALVSARLAGFGAADERFEEVRSELRELSAQLAQLVQLGGSTAAYDAVIVRRDALERELVRRAAPGEGEASPLDFDPAALAKSLGPDQALVAYRRYRRSAFAPGAIRETIAEHLCAFVLRCGDSSGAPSLVELGPLDAIEGAVGAWRGELAGARGRGVGVSAAEQATTDGACARQLRELVFDPLSPLLDGVHRLVVVEDDVLHTVPFDALPVDGDAGEATPLGDRYAIEPRLTSLELLFPVAPTDAVALLAVGGVAFDRVGPAPGEAPDEESALEHEDGPTGLEPPAPLRGGAWEAGFTPLPATEPEARGIAELYSREQARAPTRVLVGTRASREAIEAAAPDVRFLHIATHGWFAPGSVRSWDDPIARDGAAQGTRMSIDETVVGSSAMALCGLALAGANLPADDIGRYPGLVTAQEISTWNLARCELAVLSACDTSVGLRRAGQGVASLQRALHMAGARSVLTSLWKVPDDATRALMLDFYRRMWVEGAPKHRALWEAKRSLREAGHPPTAWAGWVLTGDPN